MTADVVVVAAGAGSAPLMRTLGHNVPLIHERGYHLEGPCASWPKEMPIIVLEDRGLLITRFENTLRLASFTEFSAPGAPPDRKKFKKLHLYAENLGITFDQPPTEWVGSRPTLPDYMPAIGRSEKADNLLYAFGHNHLGLTLAPSTADIIAKTAAGIAPNVDQKTLSLSRFG
ncbi:MAG: FAD-binding oxidoreductase [Pseudomonadota bacterium]